MSASKSKSNLCEISGNKAPKTPRSKSGKAGPTKADPNSPTPLQNPRNSVDRSPKPGDSNISNERRSPKISIPPEKQSCPSKGSDFQEQFDSIQGDLTKANEKILVLEKEKNLALDELSAANSLVKDANAKLQEALVAQKKAEECTEIEKFRALELEQANIEAAQKRDEEWRKVINGIRNQHAVDASALLSATQELQKFKNELKIANDSKEFALNDANVARKMAEMSAEKAELLSGELSHFKSLLDSLQQSKSNEAAELIEELGSEIVILKHELDEAKIAERKLIETEGLVEGLRVEVHNLKNSEFDKRNLAEEWKKKVGSLEAQLEEANKSEKSSLDSLALVSKQLEEQSALMQDSESEVAALKGKLESVDIELTCYKDELDESKRKLDVAQKKVSEKEKEAESLNAKIQQIEKEKVQALSDEKASDFKVESLSAEKKKLTEELDIAQNERKHVMKAMDGLTAALHEASTEVKNTRERLIEKEHELENANSLIVELKSSLKSIQDNYEAMLIETRYEIVCLKDSVERYEVQANDQKSVWSNKEAGFVNAIRRSEEEAEKVRQELMNVLEALKLEEANAEVTKKDGEQMLNNLRHVELEKFTADKAVEEAKAESSKLKERLLDKENELQSIIQENDDLRLKEAAAQEKVEELHALLEESKVKMFSENGELKHLNDENEYEVVIEGTEKEPKQTVVEINIEKAGSGEDTKLVEFFNEEIKAQVKEATENVYGEKGEAKTINEEKTYEELPLEKDQEAESVDYDHNLKMDTASINQTNGLTSENTDNGSGSPTKQFQQKKKKALLQKFGSLLKRKSSNK